MIIKALLILNLILINISTFKTNFEVCTTTYSYTYSYTYIN